MQPSVLSHERSPVTYAVAVTVAAALIVLTPRIGSRLVSLGSGLAAGGAFATALCGLAWRDGVPNPLVRGDIAFNLADVAITVGVGTLVGGSLLHAWANRGRLREQV